MAYPVPVVEIAFSDGPYVVSPTWTDVTAYVTDLSTSRGRDDDWGRFTGTAQVTLLNNDRRFDPFYTSGPYYGNLKPRRQIRIRSTWNGNTYDVFRGFIQGWPPAWTDAGKMSTVTLSCFDALDLLGSSPLPVDWSRNLILSLGPRHYFPMDEPITPYDNTLVIRDYGSFPMNMTAAAGVVSSEAIGPGLASKAISAPAGTAATTIIGPAMGAGNFTITCWACIGEGNIQGYFQNTGFALGYLSTIDNFHVRVHDGSTSRQWTINGDFDFYQSHHYAFAYDTILKSITLWVDGVVMSTSVTSSVIGPTPLYEQLTAVAGQFQQLCAFTYTLTTANVQDIYRYGAAQLPETTTARFDRLRALTPFSASMFSGPASPASSVLDVSGDASAVNSELEKVADSEFAPLFVSKSGIVTLFQQNQIRTQSTSIVSQVTYGAGGVSIGQNVLLEYDGDSLRNVVNVFMSGGGSWEQTNSASVTANGQSDLSIDTQVKTLDNAKQVANIASGWGGQVYANADEFEVVLSPSASWAATLNLELCDRFTLSVQPPSGNAITVPMLLGRVRHEARPGSWRTYVTGSARWAAAFILDQSVLDGTDLLG